MNWKKIESVLWYKIQQKLIKMFSGLNSKFDHCQEDQQNIEDIKLTTPKKMVAKIKENINQKTSRCELIMDKILK